MIKRTFTDSVYHHMRASITQRWMWCRTSIEQKLFSLTGFCYWYQGIYLTLPHEDNGEVLSRKQIPGDKACFICTVSCLNIDMADPCQKGQKARFHCLWLHVYRLKRKDFEDLISSKSGFSKRFWVLNSLMNNNSC